MNRRMAIKLTAALVLAIIVAALIHGALADNTPVPEPPTVAADQFHGLAIKGEVPDEHIELARDVLARWTLEAEGWQDVGRVLPSRFLYFEGDGRINHFSTQYGGGEYWRP